ncbi:MAG: LamG domain-containing protein, partial [Bacteroidota bacterium]
DVIQASVSASNDEICLGDDVQLSATTNVVTSACPEISGTLTNGLVGYWPFCGNANDASGNGNSGTVNGATLTADRFGNANSAYSFDGIDDWIIANPLNISNSYSISTWIFANSNLVSSESLSNSNSGATYLSQGGSNSPCNYCDFGLGIKSGPYGAGSIACNDPYFNFERGNGCTFQHYANCNPNFSQYGTWQHALYTYNGTDLKFYLNGVLQWTQQNALPLLNSGFPLSIGRRNVANNPNNYGNWNGKIDDIGIWNRALTQAEILYLYTQSQTSYLWSNGATTQSITVSPTQTTTYSCDVTVNGQTCTASQVVDVIQASVSASNDEICLGDDVQ